MPSPSSSPPLPFLPIELKKEILKFCDQATLAKTSSLSLAFLQLSSPLLYRHIVFEGPEGLTKFLTLVAEKRHPELEPWLDLSLVHSVTYIEDQEDPFNSLKAQKTSPIEPHRLLLPSSSTPGRLSLHFLKIVLPEGTSDSRVHLFFEPIEFRLDGVPGGSVSWLFVNPSRWTRLRRLVFVDAFLSVSLMDWVDSRCKAGLEDELEIIYDLSRSWYPRVESWVGEDLDVEVDDERDASCIQSISVLLSTQGERRNLLEKVAGSLLLPRITVLVKSSTETASHVIAST